MSTTAKALAAGLHQFAASAPEAPTSFAGFLADDPAAVLQSVDAATPGVFVFADRTPTDPAGFAAALRDLIARLEPGAPARVLWLRGLTVAGCIRVAAGVLAQPCSIRFHGYGVVLAAGCSLALEADALIVRRASGSDPHAISMITRAGLGRLPADPDVGARIPLASGTIGFAITAHPAETGSGHAQRSGLDLLDANLRYFFDASQDPDAPVAPAGALASLDYPIFDASAGPIALHVQIDPVRPMEPARSHLGFLAPGEDGAATTILRSHFVDQLGRRLWLRPIVAGGLRPRLVFAKSPAYGPGGGASLASNTWAYLCPEGSFEIVAAPDAPEGAKPVDHVLAGLSGVEYFRFEAAARNRLIFVPHQPALASGFRFAGSRPAGDPREVFVEPGPAPAGAPVFDAHATTSYVYLQGEQRTVYYAQPDTSVLWMGGEVDAFLEYMEVDTGELPDPGTAEAPRGLPIVPYRGTAARRDALLREFEIQALSPARRGRIDDYVTASAAEPEAPLATPAAQSVTTQGLEAQFDPATNVWTSLMLAMPPNRRNPLTLVGAGGPSDAKGIAGPLRAALQTNRLFMVISGNEFSSFGALENPIIAIEGWDFNLTPASWDRHGTILLFKFNDRSITQMLADTREWVGADRFNVDPDATRVRLAEIIAEAQAAVGGGDGQEADPDAEAAFGEFLRVVESPHWQGVLALQVDLPLGGLPDEIAMLAVGIDSSQFKAHHFGVTLAPIEYEFGSVPAMDPSSHFGLIRYVEPPGRPAPKPYDYVVESLMVRFYNSLVVDFASTVRLRVGEVFGDPVSEAPLPEAPKEDPTIFRLLGVLERHDGQPTYTFASQRTKQIVVDSHVLSDLVIARVEQKTTTSADAASGGTTGGYFQLRGFARYAAQDNLDAFSFGAGEGATGGGLEFERVLLHMSAPLPPAGTDAAIVPQWRFDVSEALLDDAKSQPRAQSLYARFPLTLRGFAQAAGAAPTAAGYIPVSSGLPEAKIGEQWYGIVFDLDMGTVGDLVGSGDFTAQIMLAWSPNTGGKALTFTGLRLPGSDGAQKSFEIQGLFNMKIADISLLAHAEPARTSYTMILRDVAFDLMRLRFPTVGSVNFMLFGDPDSVGKPDSLGWYLAYAK